MKPWDIAIIGGGILGTSVAYWLSTQYEGRISVYEQEADVATHSSGRNTGVVHRPFYLHPEKSWLLARSALLSYDMWEQYAKERGLPWKVVGTLKVALGGADVRWLKTYLKWAEVNGIPANEVEVMDAGETEALEPNLVCQASLYAKKEAAVDFRAFTRGLKKDAEAMGVKFLLNRQVHRLKPSKDAIQIVIRSSNEPDEAVYVVNCAGGNAVDLAHSVGVALEYTDLHFRGDYWRVAPEFAHLVRRNIYTVPRHPSFPFLDPHWIVRASGRVEIGPSAVPVASPSNYEGFVNDIPSAFRKILEPPMRNKAKLGFDPTFVELALREALGSMSKGMFVDRIRGFLPCFRESMLQERAAAGIRSSVINPDGKFVGEVLELEGAYSTHLLNYNSPGASGAPAYTAHVIDRLTSRGCLDHMKSRTMEARRLWNYQETIERFH